MKEYVLDHVPSNNTIYRWVAAI